jgi:hypothetical protein
MMFNIKNNNDYKYDEAEDMFTISNYLLILRMAVNIQYLYHKYWNFASNSQ